MNIHINKIDKLKTQPNSSWPISYKYKKPRFCGGIEKMSRNYLFIFGEHHKPSPFFHFSVLFVTINSFVVAMVGADLWDLKASIGLSLAL